MLPNNTLKGVGQSEKPKNLTCDVLDHFNQLVPLQASNTKLADPRALIYEGGAYIVPVKQTKDFIYFTSGVLCSVFLKRVLLLRWHNLTTPIL